MEFLDANLTKDSNLLLHAIHSPFYWRIFEENQTKLFSGLKKPELRIRIHMFLGLPDPDPDPSIIMQK